MKVALGSGAGGGLSGRELRIEGKRRATLTAVAAVNAARVVRAKRRAALTASYAVSAARRRGDRADAALTGAPRRFAHSRKCPPYNTGTRNRHGGASHRAPYGAGAGRSSIGGIGCPGTGSTRVERQPPAVTTAAASSPSHAPICTSTNWLSPGWLTIR